MDGNRWLGVELRHLVALAAVHQNGSFRGAADSLGYVQSAVSQQIAKLEQIVGVRLVERTRGHSVVHLSEAGMLLLGHAEAILARLHAAQADLDEIGDRGERPLRVGVHDSIAARLLPGALSLLEREWPAFPVAAFSVDGSAEAARRISQGQLEVAFDHLPLPAGPFEFVEVLCDPCVLVVPADSALAERVERPSLKELGHLPLIESRSWRLLGRLRALCSEAGSEPHVVQSSGRDSVVQALVASGAGVAILPRLAVDNHRDDITTIDLTGVMPALRLALFWHREGSPEGLQAFAAAVRDFATQLDGDGSPVHALAA